MFCYVKMTMLLEGLILNGFVMMSELYCLGLYTFHASVSSNWKFKTKYLFDSTILPSFTCSYQSACLFAFFRFIISQLFVLNPSFWLSMSPYRWNHHLLRRAHGVSFMSMNVFYVQLSQLCQCPKEWVTQLHLLTSLLLFDSCNQGPNNLEATFCKLRFKYLIPWFPYI